MTANNPFWWLEYVTFSPESWSEYGISREEADKLIDKFYQDYPEVRRWQDTMMLVATSGRAVRGGVKQ